MSTKPSGHKNERGASKKPRAAKQSESAWNYLEAQKEFDRRLLSHHAPATVFINQDLGIIHTRGNVNRYLKLSPGRANLSILKMAREGLLMDLRIAISRAKKENAPIRKQSVQIKNGNGNGGAQTGDHNIRYVRFEVSPINIGNVKKLYFMIIFHEEQVEGRATRGARRITQQRESEASTARIVKLEQELAATKEYLQSAIETQEATNKELQSANEEILSSNEELQSTNEELETAKEELQSANEELTTVNDELHSRNTEINQVNNDLTNLFANIDNAVLMIGSDLTIRRFTPEAQKFLGLIPADVGRPLVNVNPTVTIPDFQTMVHQVLSSFRPVEKEIDDSSLGRFQLRILPYRTADNKIDGAVISIMGVSPEMKASAGQVSETRLPPGY